MNSLEDIFACKKSNPIRLTNANINFETGLADSNLCLANIFKTLYPESEQTRKAEIKKKIQNYTHLLIRSNLELDQLKRIYHFDESDYEWTRQKLKNKTLEYVLSYLSIALENDTFEVRHSSKLSEQEVYQYLDRYDRLVLNASIDYWPFSFNLLHEVGHEGCEKTLGEYLCEAKEIADRDNRNRWSRGVLVRYINHRFKRNLLLFFRRIIKIIFKNMDDQSGDEESVYNAQLIKTTFFLQKMIIQWIRTKYYADYAIS